MPKNNLIDISGQRFGRLIVIEYVKYEKCRALWKCKCDCGNECITSSYRLRHGVTKSCGCLSKDILTQKTTTHGLTKHRIYSIYRRIIDRCQNKNNKYYGGKGVQICNEWRDDFKKFYEWSINNGYSDNLSIDRIDNDGNYEPANCRWVDTKTQANNKSTNNHITYSGETHTLTEWAKIVGLKPNVVRHRIKDYGWSVEDALTIELYGKHHRREKIVRNDFYKRRHI